MVMSVSTAPTVLGLDVGGANLKAAHTSEVALTRAFALWNHPDQLAARLRTICAQMPPHDRIALTMTGELCDCFESKREGVLAIVRSVEEAAEGTPLQVWTTHGVFVPPGQVCHAPLSAAAANWLALAHLACRFANGAPALLIDTGSTTTDIVYLEGGQPAPRGLTDSDRLASGELVYTGVRRTPVCAVLGIRVAAEFFATMLDVYLVLGLASENGKDTDTADGRPATRHHAAARLARMRCADVGEMTLPDIESLARQAVETQVSHIRGAIDRVLEDRAPPGRIVVSGSGEALGRLVLAAHPQLRTTPIVSLAERLRHGLSEAACAYAVAVLAARSAE
jgi:probable H4MPT-linked C1 transfer pathway protein